MLSSADADLARRDPQLPGLATVLDPVAFVVALEAFVPGAKGATAQISYVRYKPAKSCVVAYRLEGAGETVELYAKVHSVSGGESLRAGGEASTARTQRGTRRIILADGAIAAYVFPTDAKLKTLRLLADPHKRRVLLRTVVPDRRDLWSGRLRPLRYMPERRYVTQLLADKGTGAVLKVYGEHGYPTAQRNARAFCSEGPLRVVRPLGHSDQHRILIYAWQTGRLLSEVIADSTLETHAMMQVGAALAELHTQDAEGLACLTREGELATLFALSANVGFVSPHFAGRLEQLVRSVATRLAQAPLVNQPIHGDFYAKQVLLTGDTVTILDLDRSVRGDPAADLGLFIAHLERAALCGTLPAGRVAPLTEALFEGYRSVTRGPIPRRVPLYTAVGLVRLAPDPFRYREAQWPERTAAILERAEATIETDVARTRGVPAQSRV